VGVGNQHAKRAKKQQFQKKTPQSCERDVVGHVAVGSKTVEVARIDLDLMSHAGNRLTK
jgi:hypothetical protein